MLNRLNRLHHHRAIVVASCIALLPWTAMAESPNTEAPGAADQGQAFLEAAQQQDLATMKSLLAAGTDVNSPTRYGSTALFFAADKGNVEMAKLLLSKGAKVDVTDTFYGATPLGWAVSNLEKSAGHRQVVLLILGQAPTDVAGVLPMAARLGDVELAKAALATDNVPIDEIQVARKAVGEDNTKFLALLDAHAPAADEAETKVMALSQEQRQRYVGDFKNEDRDLVASVAVGDENLALSIAGEAAIVLECIGEDTFRSSEDPGLEFNFGGRGGLVEGFRLTRGEFSLYFARHSKTTEVAAAPTPLAPLKTAERRAAAPWPAFRGANAAGVGDGQGIPFEWQGEGGKHVRWKTEIPGIGLSSPVVWGDRIFITTAISGAEDDTFRTGLYGDVDSVDDMSEHVWKVYALDRESGRILWQKEASRRVPKVKRHLKSSHANPTPVTDGKYVVAHFASEGIFCYDMDGNLKWKKDLGTLNSGWFFDTSYEWGFASSPILHDGRLILQTDIQKGSHIAAFDVATGKELWRTAREEIPTWGTPTILPAATADGVDEVVTNGTTIRGYSVETGEELWTLTPNSEVTVGTPVIGEGMAYVTGGYPPARPIYAIKPGGRGDLSLQDNATSSEHIAWSVNPGGTYIPTPIYYRGILYMLNNGGRLAAYDAVTGERIYRQRVDSGTSFSASPVAADGRLLITAEDGLTYVVRAGKTYEELGRNELGEVVMTTPAISDGLLVIRGIDAVYGIGFADDGATDGP